MARSRLLASATVLAGLCLATLAGPQAAEAAPARAASFRSWAPIGDYERTALEHGTTFRISLPTREGNLDVAFHPASVLADSYQAESIDWRSVRSPLEQPDVQTYTGRLAPESGQRDFAKLARLPDGRISGLLRATGVLYELRTEPWMGESMLWIREIPASEIAGVVRGCGLWIAENAFAAFSMLSEEPPVFREIDLATEADGALVALSGGAAEANARILAIVNAVNGFYESDLGLSNRVVFQRAWSGPDPYVSKGADPLLAEFRSRFSKDVSVPHDDAQLFSGRDFKGKALGASWIASACNDGRYGVNQARGISDASIAMLLAHQEAHNLGAGHGEHGLMAPSHAAAEFSPATRSDIEAFLSGASCISEPAPGQAPLLDPVGPQQVAEGGLLELALTASDADGDALFFDAFPLPPGASITPEGRLLYEPRFDAAGCGLSQDVSIQLIATDSSGRQASEIVPIEVADLPTGASPVLEDPKNVVVDAGQVVFVPLVASDADGDALTFSSSPLPAGAILDPSGVIVWQPTNESEGRHFVIVSATDCSGNYSLQSFSIQVNRVPAPHLISLSPSSGPDGVLVEITGSGFEGAGLEVSFGSKAASVQSVSATVVVVEAPPRCNGPSSVSVSVTRDGIASDNSLTFTYQGWSDGGDACLQGMTGFSATSGR
jgi:hypothetical protein